MLKTNLPEEGKKIFVGKVEHIQPESQGNGKEHIDFCISDSGLMGFASLEVMVQMAAAQYGKDVLEKITFEAPPGVDYTGCEHGLTPKIYRELNAGEKTAFNKFLAEELKKKSREKEERYLICRNLGSSDEPFLTKGIPGNFEEAWWMNRKDVADSKVNDCIMVDTKKRIVEITKGTIRPFKNWLSKIFTGWKVGKVSE